MGSGWRWGCQTLYAAFPRGERVNLRAVIFDVDGVLVQSMERHYEAYSRAFALEGIEIRPEEVYANEGRRSREVIESLVEARTLSFSKERLDELNTVKQRTFFGFGPLPLYPGARRLVERLKDSGRKVAAVTGTNRANVDNHLGEIIERFDVIVTADDVKRTKPDPEPYLSALEKLSLPASAAIVVENATLGIRSAKAAGIRVCAVTSTLPAHMLKDADVIVPTIADVWSLVEADA